MIAKHSDLKKKRMIGFFLDAAQEIVETDGFSALSIRNVADRAGYNSATIYNYFDNFDQLVAFMVIRKMSDYIVKSINILENIRSPFDDWIALWRVFCLCAFANPAIFSYAYAADKQTMNSIQRNTKKYFELFYDELEIEDNAYFSEHYDDVNILIQEELVRKGLFSREDAESAGTFGHYLFIGILNDALNRHDKSAEEYTEDFMRFFVPYLSDLCHTQPAHSNSTVI